MRISQESTCVGFFFNNVAGPQNCSCIKKRLQHRFFPVKFMNFSKISILRRGQKCTKVNCYCQQKVPPEWVQMQEFCSLSFLNVQKVHLHDTSGESLICIIFKNLQSEPSRCTNADLKISQHVRIHIKTISWKFHIPNPKNSRMINPWRLYFLKK